MAERTRRPGDRRGRTTRSAASARRPPSCSPRSPAGRATPVWSPPTRPRTPGRGMAEALRGINEHIATGGEDCRYCPVCQVIHAVRETSPEVKAHLASAASSLMHAAAGVLATQVPRSDRPSGVEKIDLDDEGDPGRS